MGSHKQDRYFFVKWNLSHTQSRTLSALSISICSNMFKHKCRQIRSTGGRVTMFFTGCSIFSGSHVVNCSWRLELVWGKLNWELSGPIDQVNNSESVDLEIFTDWIDGLLEVADDCPWETLRKAIGESGTWL